MSGTGTLLHPELVLVHPPLSRRLAGARTTPALGIHLFGAADSDVVPVAAVHLADTDASGEPLVALDLERPVDLPPTLLAEALRGADAGTHEQLLRDHLGGREVGTAPLAPGLDEAAGDPGPDDGPIIVNPDPDPTPRPVWCHLWPRSRACHRN